MSPLGTAHNIQELTNKKLTFSLLQQRGPDPAERLDEHQDDAHTRASARAYSRPLSCPFRRDVTRAGVLVEGRWRPECVALAPPHAPSVELADPSARGACRRQNRSNLSANCRSFQNTLIPYSSPCSNEVLYTHLNAVGTRKSQVSHSGLGTHATPHAPQARTVRPT